MSEKLKDTIESVKTDHATPVVGATLEDGTIVEMLHRPEEHETLFCVGKGNNVRLERELVVKGQRLVPYSPHNNLLRHEVVLLPSEPAEYDSDESLARDVREFIHRYVDVSEAFERLSTFYVLFSWLYDSFNELPYLRLLGEPGSGKTRFLLTVGSLCYRPIFASGASTVSPLFRILDAFRGTLVLDEGDFRMSDEKSELIKILNNGNGRGFPVLRSEVTGNRKEFNPTAYSVFGPKIIATRRHFQDRALETRCLTEEMGQRPLRDDVPINLPATYKKEALALRNKLLTFRLKNAGTQIVPDQLVDRSIEPRLNQIFAPLLCIVTDPKTREDIRSLAREYNKEIIADRGMETEAKVLEIIRDLLVASEKLGIKEITSWFQDRFADDYDRKITTKWIGYIVRKRLRLPTRKSHGVFMVVIDKLRIEQLFMKYGVETEEQDAEGSEDARS